MHRSTPHVLATLALTTITTMAQEPCNRWQAESATATLGPHAFIENFVTIDTGTGPLYYAVGQALTVGSANEMNVAAWDGSAWQQVGDAADFMGRDTGVPAATRLVQGGDERLVIGGKFDLIDLVPAQGIAAFDGQQWVPLGDGITPEFDTAGVQVLVAMGDEPDQLLYAAGQFAIAGTSLVNNVALWDGTSWSSLEGPSGIGVNGLVVDAIEWNGNLLVVGDFTEAGGLPADGAALWNGSTWSALPPLPGPPTDLELFQGMPHLCTVSGVNGSVYRLDGIRWTQISSGFTLRDGNNLHSDVDDGQERLYFGGFARSDSGSTSRPTYWDGSDWRSLPQSVDRTVISFGRSGSDPDSLLWLNGPFDTVGVEATERIAMWNGEDLLPPTAGFNDMIRDLLIVGTGVDSTIYAAGDFTTAPGLRAAFVAKLQDGQWAPLGQLNDKVYDLEWWDDGTGPALYAVGSFTQDGSETVRNFARWDGSAWIPVGGGLGAVDQIVTSLAVFDDGRGEALYIGGQFRQAGAVPVNNIARWDGSAWDIVSRGVDGGVLALTVHDDGAGEKLFVGGVFTRAGGLAGVDASRVASWDGVEWQAVDGGANDHVFALASLPTDGGDILFMGGRFTQAGDTPTAIIAYLDEDGQWAEPDGGLGGLSAARVLSMHPTTDNGEPVLLVGGRFDTAGTLGVGSLALFRPGVGWRDVNGLFGQTSGAAGVIDAIATMEGATERRVWAGGLFGVVSGTTTSNLASRGLDCPCLADCDGDGTLTLFDFLCFQNNFATGSPDADCDGDGLLTLFDFLCFQNAFAAGCS